MKNLSAFPRFPLSEALMILITLVVCLAGFTKAEVITNYKKEDASQQKNENSFLKNAGFLENPSYVQQASETKNHELQGKNFAGVQNFPESPLDKPIKRHSDYFGESDESESEKESDGYGYDDDEYYHFNFKRNDGSNKKIENNKLKTENEINSNEKEFKSINSNINPISKNMKDNQECQTIEMLKFKETHPVISQVNPENSQNSKPFSNPIFSKTLPPTNTSPMLKGIDFKENSAINDNTKEGKEESAVLAGSESKIVDAKKEIKVGDEKDSNSKLKDSKLEEDSEKKEKEAGLKSEKDAVAVKTLKDNSKASEDKEKDVKLSENAKLKDNIEKISSKSKDNENTKFTKEDKDVGKFTDKTNSDVFNANGLSQITNGASFVSNDYKDNVDALKTRRSQGNQRNSQGFHEAEKKTSLNEFQEDVKESPEKLKEKQFILMKNEKARNYDLLNEQSNLLKLLQGTGKSSSFLKDQPNPDYQNSNNLFKKREPWRETGKVTKFNEEFPIAQHPSQQQQMQQQAKQDLSQDLDYQLKHLASGLPSNEIENTEYYKNYMKSLKKYKSQTDNSKNSPTDTGSFTSSEETEFHFQDLNKKKKRSRSQKRRSMLMRKDLKNEKSPNEHLNQRRNTYGSDSSVSDPIQHCLKKPQTSKSLHETKAAEVETDFLENKNYFDLWDNHRQRRKSPQKLEYEIKIFNQNTPDTKNAKFSHFTNNRLKKDTKTKLGIEGKYLKKYPYSQVSRDDLTRLSEKESENEKKFKRKAPVWKRDNQKSIIQTRAVPSGYYSNRVKFGQKSFTKNNEKETSDLSVDEVNQLSPTHFSQTPSEPNKNSLQRAREVKWLNYKHEPTKRFNENQYLNAYDSGKSLLLVKKGERMAKVFQEGNQQRQNKENDFSSNQLSNILSEDKNYFGFKKLDVNKFQKDQEAEPSALNFNELEEPLYEDKKLSLLESSSSGLLSNKNGQPVSMKGLHVRSSHSDKNDKKFISAFHNGGAKSNLRKTFEKFRDLAGFFKDNEQESTDNQYSTQEAKEGEDIVFSQDKLPDPIVINNDDSSKSNGLKQEPINSIFSISNNFKNLDLQNKKIEYPSSPDFSKNFLAPEVKMDNMESSWKPALKEVFPEAKSVNSVNKNGNEIIVLDLDSNRLKIDHEHNPLKMMPKEQSQPCIRNLDNNLANEKQIFTINKAPLVFHFAPIAASDKTDLLANDRAVAIIRSADNKVQIPESLRELAELPTLLKKFMNKMPLEMKSNTKLVNRKSLDEKVQNEVSQNYNQLLKDYDKTPDVKQKKEIIIPQTSYSEMSAYNNLNIKNLGNVLQSLLNPVSSTSVNAENLSFEMPKNLYGNQNSNQQYRNLQAAYQPDFTQQSQGQWSSAQEKSKDFFPFSQGKQESDPKVDDEISNILHLDGSRWNEKNNENKLWKELAATSEKIHRLRREGMETEKLKKTIEDAMSFKDTRGSDDSGQYTGSNSQDQNKRYNSRSASLESTDKSSNGEEVKNGNNLDLESHFKEAGETKEGSEISKSPKSRYDSHLTELFENLSTNKNQKNSNDNKKKRMDTSRRKRFSENDVSNKVSKIEVQNTLLKSLAEDNYQSVYSPGIKRRLLSTDNEMEDADSYSNEPEHISLFNSQDTQEKPLDPMIVKLLLTDSKEAEKNRARRSLTSGFHSNFKREIDLDESMPNDFQNFLVTSLGGFGSQKREVVKKGEALWEGKEMTQDNYNQIVESGKDPIEDYAVEKREVPSSENHKSQSYKNPDYFKNDNQDQNLADVPSIRQPDKKARSDDANLIKIKPSKFADEKLPTHIRIQITNASSKEKKSSKPIMDENETTSTEMENLPKEKEFFDKNKLNPFLSRNFMKFRQHPGAKYSDNESEGIINKNVGVRRKPFHSYLWKERKKKKCAAENFMKLGQDFNGIDQKVMESLLRRYHLNHNSDQTTQQKINHLPQVETVYNPTQGGSKSQIENPRLTKPSNIKIKNSLNNKNSLQSNKNNPYDEGFVKPYFKVEEIKSDKVYTKEYEDPDWKTYNGRLNLEQEPYGANSPNTKAQNRESSLFQNKELSEGSSPPVDQYNMNPNGQKWLQTSSSNYFSHNSNSGVMNPQVLYDVIRLKQQMKNRNGMEKENLDLKPISKPMFPGDVEGQEIVQKAKNNLPSFPNWLDGNGNNLDFPSGKGSYGELPVNNKNYDNSGVKNPKDFGVLKHGYPIDGTYTKNLYDKPPALDPSQAASLDNSKDVDYMENLDEEYQDVEVNKEPPNEEGLDKESLKQQNKDHEQLNYHRLYNNYKHFRNNYKNSEAEDNINEDEDEFDEEYEENGEDEDSEDYSQFEYKKEVEPEMTKFPHGGPKLRGSLHGNVGSSNCNYYYPEFRGNRFDQTKFNSNPENKGNLIVPVEEVRSESDRVSGSNELLRKANEKTNIFGKNLMKKLYGSAHEGVFNRLDKFQNEKALEDMYPVFGNKLSKRKLDSGRNLRKSQQARPVGSRMFYAAKIELNDGNDLCHPTKLVFGSKRSGRNAYQLPKRNPFYAEFASGENDFDHEIEENGIRFNDNLIKLEKNDDVSQQEKNLLGATDKNTRDDENSENVKDVEENLEHGDEDNILENVIGKYIMRKKIKSSNDLSKGSEELTKKKLTDKNFPDDSGQHKLKKRSIEKPEFGDKAPKILKKRLSSGHLTENNFKKYHKKNFTKKRHIADSELSTPYDITALIKDKENNLRKEKAKDQMKRSALDLFRKITSKEKDNKKVENTDGRSAGFEPLLSLNDKSKGFIKDPKDLILFQEKQTLKNTEAKNNPPELKAHYPNEGQRLRAQLIDKKKSETKESEQEESTAPAQGPWKVELNDKYDSSNLRKEKGYKTLKDAEKGVFKDQNSRYNTFLLISNSAKVAEQNPEIGFPSVSKSLQRDVGNGYRTKNEECRRIPINHVRKRSLKSTKYWMKGNAEDASQTSGDFKIKEADEINSKENIGALHKAKTPLEEYSKSQASNVVQKNTRTDKSFAIPDEENQNSQFFSKGRLINRKSVFPPSSDAKIIRDSRHINEETSEYHSQRIVDAILSQVSENSKFKELIAPGLVMRTPAYKEGVDSKSEAGTEMNFSEELQSFLRKFMFDLENLAEQHVKKRMCRKIDKNLKQFLQSLLSIPIGNVKENKNINDAQKEKCSLSSLTDTREWQNLSEGDQNSYQTRQDVFDDMKNKQYFLKKLFGSCQNLSQVEKETLGTNYLHLLKQLELPKAEPESLNNASSLIQNDEGIYTKETNTNNNFGSNAEKSEIINEALNFKNPEILKTSEAELNLNLNSGTRINDKLEAKTSSYTDLPVFYVSNTKTSQQEINTTPSMYENVVKINSTDMSKNDSDDLKKQSESQNEFKDSEQKSPTPDNLYLLPFQTTTQQPNTYSPFQDSENIQIKPPLTDNKLLKQKNRKKSVDLKDFLYYPNIKPEEKHKHNDGDAAKLQMALKSQDFWSKNGEVSKIFNEVSNIIESRKTSLKNGRNQGLQKYSVSGVPLCEDFKNPRNLIASYNENSDFTNLNFKVQCSRYHHKKPHFFCSTPRKLLSPSSRPFYSVNECQLFPGSRLKCRPYCIVPKIYQPCPIRRPMYIKPKDFAQPSNQRKKYLRESNLLKKNILKKKKSVVSSFQNRHLRRLQEVAKTYE